MLDHNIADAQAAAHLRNHFAALAMQSLIQRTRSDPDDGYYEEDGVSTAVVIARQAYDFADAMIAESQRKQ